jgi:integrase
VIGLALTDCPLRMLPGRSSSGPATLKQYRDIWQNHLKPRMGSLTLRGFRTVHGESMLAVLIEPARTVVLTAAFSGLRKSELQGLTWADFDGKELTVRRSIWNGIVSEPKTRRSRAPIPVVKQLADALEMHKISSGILAQPDLPIFQASNGKPLDLHNLANRVISPVAAWHGWHAFRRGLATNLHAIGVDDKTIQAILRHSNVGLTMNVYVKTVNQSQIDAMDALDTRFSVETCNDLATNHPERVN